ncbi:hypothetical protein [Flavobacterium orientale]|uniref:Uncharacterized protein n=1 Tax=Flavobacterium orientale TaxID=1756020 RepID=A0A917DCF9_9FLAO|nr:hypothetical protein [Flavobacterium orientale]GGD26480.1 hypothetical protein GCM10011343_15870 [Flavobacterium orientale]
MNLNTIYNTHQYNYLLTNEIWQKADFYAIETNSSFWNKAIVITLSKEEATTNIEALIYLLQKQTKALAIWEEHWNTTTPTVFQFIEFFIAQRGFINTIGKKVSTKLFYKNYSETISNIIAKPTFEFTKNDNREVYFNLLDQNTIINVICFDDYWHEHNYLIETKTNWILYHWSSANY